MAKPGRKKLSDFIENPLSKAKAAVGDLLAGHPEDASENARRATAALIKSVLLSRQNESGSGIEAFRQIWGKGLPDYELDHLTMLVQAASPIKVSEALGYLENISSYEKLELLNRLVLLAAQLGDPDGCREYLWTLAAAFGVAETDFEEIRKNASDRAEKRRKLLKSGAGVVVALIVIGVFILTATLLKSVIFGLMLAYLLLPLEQFFERRIQKKGALLNLFFGSLEAMPRKKSALSKSEANDRRRRTLVSRAVSLTSLSFLAFLVLLSIGIWSVSGGYLSRMKNSVRDWTRAAVVSVQQSEAAAATAASTTPVPFPPQSASDATAVAVPEKDAGAVSTKALPKNDANLLFSKLEKTLENQRSKFENLPFLRSVVDEVGRALRDPEAQRQMLGLVASKTGGIFSFTAGMLWRVCSLALDVLLTLFFFMLFLGKLADAREAERTHNGENYLVRAIFNGSWLPGARDEVLAEADRIIGEVGHKLKVWLRGYLTLVSIDFTVYSVVFFFLGVPYFLILGFIAGCGILLPFLGPIASAVITIVVTLAVEGQSASMLQLCGIAAIYLIHNGITEQFILYPSVIGESLGLTTLETIIVVLLGGIFAGITGMIFALPAAAVLKYLVPQIYNCWR